MVGLAVAVMQRGDPQAAVLLAPPSDIDADRAAGSMCDLLRRRVDRDAQFVP